MSDAEDKLLNRIKACFKVVCDAEAGQRTRERDDLMFQVSENQWDADVKKWRQGTATSPARPMLSVSLLNQPMALIKNQAEAAELGVQIHSVSEAADPETAEVKQDLYRRIERGVRPAVGSRPGHPVRARLVQGQHAVGRGWG
jgi:hypothetical protein